MNSRQVDPVNVVEEVPPPPRTIEVAVGNPATTFHIDKEAACAASRFFRAVSSKRSSSPLPPGSNCSVSLPGHDPAVFQMYTQWLTAQPRPEPLAYQPEECSKEPWFSLAANACVLGSRLRAPEFERYALSQLIQSCASMPFGPWKFIESIPRRHRSQPLERFGNHWVAWNYSFMAPDGLPNEYSNLKAAALAVKVTKDGTPDPRLLDLDHWYHRCGNSLTPECLHNPHVRERNRMEEDLEAGRRRRLEREMNRRYSSESYLYEWKKQTGDDGG